MNIFYNKEGIGDTLLITLKQIPSEDRQVERKGDIARVYSVVTNETVAINVFEASTYVDVQENGMVTITEHIVNTVNELLAKEGFEDTLVLDLSPKFVIGYVIEKEKHPNADKLNICKVDVGTDTLQIVCGAPNVEQGQKVVVAKVGAVMPSGLVIKDANLRGVDSFGMICSARELDLPDAPQEKGILVLEADAEVGKAFFN
ncbi:YtpR family tRNA-binding protein [Gottfriedia sp. NPDC057991]|uniref:YtpR family tRNA-binding protein n=1 Tax=Gottfriedia sp. NPDC057991 TaxID=3346298 RepID=UPI0036D96409